MIEQTVNNQINSRPHWKDALTGSWALVRRSFCFSATESTGRKLCEGTFMQNCPEFSWTWHHVGLWKKLVWALLGRFHPRPNTEIAIIWSIWLWHWIMCGFVNCLRSDWNSLTFGACTPAGVPGACLACQRKLECRMHCYLLGLCLVHSLTVNYWDFRTASSQRNLNSGL